MLRITGDIGKINRVIADYVKTFNPTLIFIDFSKSEIMVNYVDDGHVLMAALTFPGDAFGAPSFDGPYLSYSVSPAPPARPPAPLPPFPLPGYGEVVGT